MPAEVAPGVQYRLIAGLPGYRVGDDGSVWSSFTNNGRGHGWHRLSVHRRPYGSRYCVVSLRADNGKGKVVCRYVHRLVLDAFVGVAPDGTECAHEDGDTSNNSLGNLSWKTHATNEADKYRHGTRGAKLTVEAVAEIRSGGASDEEFAIRFGVSASQVQRARIGLGWRLHTVPPRLLRSRRGPKISAPAGAVFDQIIKPATGDVQ